MEQEKANVMAQAGVPGIKRLLQAVYKPVAADTPFKERLLKRLRKEIGGKRWS